MIGNRAVKVLLTTDWWEPVVNGVVASVKTLKRTLETLGCEVRVLTLAPGWHSSMADGIYRVGSVSASLIYDRARIAILRNDPIRREILEWAPDIVHAQCEFSTFGWARRLARELDVPLVHTYHTIYEDYTHYYSPSRTMGRKMVGAFSRRILSRTDAVIAPTRKVARLLDGYGVHTPIHVVPTGLDLERFRPARTEAEHEETRRIRRDLGIGPKQTVLLSVCRMAKEKNLEEILHHVAEADRADCVLVLVGDGPSRPELERLAHDLGIADRVRFVGCIAPSDVPRWYRIGDVFLSASLSETQGLTFIEALASGLPLLCRRDPSLTGVVLDGVTGWQYEGSADFALRLADLLDSLDQRALVSRTGADHARQTCGADTFGRSVLDVYRGLLDARLPLAPTRALAPVAA